MLDVWTPHGLLGISRAPMLLLFFWSRSLQALNLRVHYLFKARLVEAELELLLFGYI